LEEIRPAAPDAVLSPHRNTAELSWRRYNGSCRLDASRA